LNNNSLQSDNYRQAFYGVNQRSTVRPAGRTNKKEAVRWATSFVVIIQRFNIY
jgi:hypothetical protein